MGGVVPDTNIPSLIGMIIWLDNILLKYECFIDIFSEFNVCILCYELFTAIAFGLICIWNLYSVALFTYIIRPLSEIAQPRFVLFPWQVQVPLHGPDEGSRLN